jgi:hypothetical protein
LVQIHVNSHKVHLNSYNQSHISLKFLKSTNESLNFIKSTKISNEINLIQSNSLKSYKQNHILFKFHSHSHKQSHKGANIFQISPNSHISFTILQMVIFHSYSYKHSHDSGNEGGEGCHLHQRSCLGFKEEDNGGVL